MSFVDTYHRTHPGRRYLMSEVRMSWDEDQWGSAMMWWFGVAHVLTHVVPAWAIPEHWEYRQGAGCRGSLATCCEDYPDETIAAMYIAGQIHPNDLIYAGNILGRYADWLKLAGKDY